jgi:uncharacterized membrane protein required for colicin V production
MIIFEILAVIVIAAFVANGVKAGSIETLGRVLGAVVGFLIARSFSSWLVGFVSMLLPKDWAFVASFLFIFLVVDTLIGMIFRLAEGILKIFTRLPILKQLNGLLGAILGFLEAIVVVGGASWLIEKSSTLGGASFLTKVTVVKLMNLLFQKTFGIFM